MAVQNPVRDSAAPLSYRSLTEPSRLPDRTLAFVDTHRRLLLVGVTLLYLLSFNGQWRVERDSALYLSIGRNLALGEGYTYQGEPHHLAFPGLPLLFAGLFKLFHTDSVIPALVLMLLMGFATLGLMYRLFLLHCDRPTAVLMTVGLGITRLFHRYCFELLSDLPFLLGVMAFLVGYEAIFFRRAHEIVSERSDATGNRTLEYVRPRGEHGTARDRWFDWVFLIGGFSLAVAMRPAMWVLLAAVGLAVAWAVLRSALRGRISWSHLLAGLAVAALMFLFLWLDPRSNNSRSLPQYEDYFLHWRFTHLGQVYHEMIGQNIPELLNGVLSKALFGCSIYLFNYLAAAIVIGLCFWLLSRRALWGFWALLTLVLLMVFKPLDRYLLPIVPLLVFGWWQFLVWLHDHLPARWGRIAFAGLFIGGACTNLARLGETVVEQRRVPFLAAYRDGRYVSMTQVGNMVRQRTPRKAFVLVGPKAGRIMTYVSHRWAVEASEQTRVDPATTEIYALTGPSWDEGKLQARDANGPPVDIVTAWVQQHHYRLGPQIGAAIERPTEREPWRLFRVLPE